MCAEAQKFPPGSYISFTKNILQMLLQSVFTDTKGLGDLIVVSVSEDLLGNLNFSGSKMVVSFQAAEGLLKTIVLRLTVGDLVEDSV